MNTNDKPRFLDLHNRLTDVHQHLRDNDGYQTACFAALAPFPLAVVEATYRDAVTTPRFGSYAPKPGELVALAQEIASLSGVKSAERWGYEWFAFLRARIHQLRGEDGTETRLKSRYDAQAVQAVADCGGLARVLNGESDRAEQRFVRAYCKLEQQYQDCEGRKLRPDEDPARPSSPVRGRVLKRPQQAAAIAASEVLAEIGYQGSQRDVVGYVRDAMRQGRC